MRFVKFVIRFVKFSSKKSALTDVYEQVKNDARAKFCVVLRLVLRILNTHEDVDFNRSRMGRDTIRIARYGACRHLCGP